MPLAARSAKTRRLSRALSRAVSASPLANASMPLLRCARDENIEPVTLKDQHGGLADLWIEEFA